MGRGFESAAICSLKGSMSIWFELITERPTGVYLKSDSARALPFVAPRRIDKVARLETHFAPHNQGNPSLPTYRLD